MLDATTSIAAMPCRHGRDAGQRTLLRSRARPSPAPVAAKAQERPRGRARLPQALAGAGAVPRRGEHRRRPSVRRSGPGFDRRRRMGQEHQQGTRPRHRGDPRLRLRNLAALAPSTSKASFLRWRTGGARPCDVPSREPRTASAVPAPVTATALMRVRRPLHRCRRGRRRAGAPDGVESLLPELRTSLAQALYLDEAAIDDDRSFVDLGLDSIVGVEWVKTINKAYGLEIPRPGSTTMRTSAHSRASCTASWRRSRRQPSRPSQPCRCCRRHAAADRQPCLPLPLAAERFETSSAQRESIPPRPLSSGSASRDTSSACGAVRATGRDAASSRPAVGRRRRTDEKIAIVGMSGRYPGAEDLDAVLAQPRRGQELDQRSPAANAGTSTRYYDPTPGKPGKIYCKWLGALDDDRVLRSACSSRSRRPKRRSWTRSTACSCRKATGPSRTPAIRAPR